MILDVETISEDSLNSLSEPLIVKERDYGLADLSILTHEIIGIDFPQFSQFLCNEFREVFEDTLPDEYIPVIRIVGIECGERQKIPGFLIKLDIFTKEALLNFIQEYKTYENSFEEGKSAESIGNVLGRNIREYTGVQGNITRLADRKTGCLVKDISSISSFYYSIYPSMLEGITFSETVLIYIKDTKGVLPPLRFREREAYALKPYDFGMKMFKWMYRVVQTISSDREEARFLSANTVTPSGVTFFVKKGGYLLPKEFDICYPDLRRTCPATIPASQRETTYTYKFEM